MNYWKQILLILFLITSISHVTASSISPLDSGRLLFVDMMAHRGSIITDSKSLEPNAQSHPLMFEFDLSRMQNTKQSWNQCKCYHKEGLTLSYVDFKNPDVLGKAVNLSIFTEPYLYYSPRFQFSLRTSAGLSYLNNVYDEETNPENLFFSSPISFLLSLGLVTNYSLGPSIHLKLAAQFNHISNGGTRYPNWGINFPTLAVGVSYQVNNQKLTNWNNPSPIDKAAKLIIRMYAGSHLADGERRMVTGLNVGLIKPLSRINGIGLGSEIVYDAINQVLENNTGKEYNTILASFSLQHYFFYGKVRFGQQLAYAIIPPTSHGSNRIYQLYTLEYFITKQWYMGTTLKAYGGASDYITISLSKEITFK